MKRKKFYIILAILTVISLFSFAALCNQCGVDTGDKVDVEEDDADETGDDNEDIDDNGDGDGDEDSDGDDDVDVEKEAPTITLEVYEGPLYSAADDVCYWRVKAIVTGEPNPTISWSKDNSNGSFGTKKAQVNLNRGETYTLIAIATNSEGSIEESIILEWGCDDPDPDPDPGSTTDDKEIFASNSGSGYIAQGFGATMGTNEVFVGDTNMDTITKGYLSFDISELSDMDGIIFTDVDLRIPIGEVGGEPWLGVDTIDIKVFYYGSNLDIPEDFEVGGNLVKTFNITDSLDNLSFGNNTLISELQDAVDSGKSSFQFKLGFNNKINNGIGDWYLLAPDSISLNVEYEIPG